MFVKDNQDGSDKTRVDYLGFIGTPVNATNMADFKRVSLIAVTVVDRCQCLLMSFFRENDVVTVVLK